MGRQCVWFSTKVSTCVFLHQWGQCFIELILPFVRHQFISSSIEVVVELWQSGPHENLCTVPGKTIGRSLEYRQTASGAGGSRGHYNGLATKEFQLNAGGPVE